MESIYETNFTQTSRAPTLVICDNFPPLDLCLLTTMFYNLICSIYDLFGFKYFLTTSLKYLYSDCFDVVINIAIPKEITHIITFKIKMSKFTSVKRLNINLQINMDISETKRYFIHFK